MDTTQGVPNNAIPNRMVGGVVLLIGVLALIAFFAIGGLFAAAVSAAGLFIGSMVLIMDGSGGSRGLTLPR